MGGKYGIAESTKIASTIGSLIVIGSKLLKGNFLALFEIVGPLNLIRTVDLEAFKKEVTDYDQAEREQVEDAFKLAIAPLDDDLEAKIGEGADILNEAVDVVVHALTVVEEGKAVIERIRTLIGA